MLQSGLAWLATQQAAHASVSVTYRRRSSYQLIVATLGRTEFELDSGEGYVEKVSSLDFIIKSDALADFDPPEPMAGDLIERGMNGVVYRYEVNAPGTEQAWIWTDPYRSSMRLHSKLIKVL
jgi:hypothetical protein